MANVFRTLNARRDLKEIRRYIGLDSREAASVLLRRIGEKATTLAEFPYIGQERLELGRDIRSLPVGNYIIFYRPVEDGIELLRVLHGSRDIPSQFGR